MYGQLTNTHCAEYLYKPMTKLWSRQKQSSRLYNTAKAYVNRAQTCNNIWNSRSDYFHVTMAKDFANSSDTSTSSVGTNRTYTFLKRYNAPQTSSLLKCVLTLLDTEGDQFVVYSLLGLFPRNIFFPQISPSNLPNTSERPHKHVL